jgi:hypothetical protein
VALGAGGKLSVTYRATAGNTADVYFDVTGYFLPGTSGSTYVALTPNRLVDSHSAIGLSTKLTAGTAKTFTVTGRHPSDPTKNVPTNAVAVTGILTVVNQTAPGRLYLGPSPLNAPTTASLYFPKGDNRATGLTVKLGAGGTLAVTFTAAAGAKTDVIFDVTGYFVPGGAGATYVPVVPNRLVNSGSGVGLSSKLAAYVAKTFQVTGRVPSDPTKNVPTGSVAITGTLTVIGQTAAGWLALTPTPNNHPSTPYLNFPMGDTRSTGVTVPLGTDGKLSVTYGAASGKTTQVMFDVSGYFLK